MGKSLRLMNEYSGASKFQVRHRVFMSVRPLMNNYVLKPC